MLRLVRGVIRKINVSIADDQPTFREGLARLLSEGGDIEIVGLSADGQDAVRVARQFSPDVAILAVEMPQLNGIEAAKQIKESCPTTAVLVLSAYGYESYLMAALKAGASGFLTKNTSLTEVMDAIRSISSGKEVLDQVVANRMLRKVAEGSGSGISELHPKELQVLGLLARGMTNKEIAQNLMISHRTVQTHLANIFSKMGVKTRTEAAYHALSKGILGPPDKTV